MGDVTTVTAVAAASAYAMKPVMQKGAEFLEKLLGRPCEVAGNLLADRLYFWQWQQRLKIAERALRKIEKRGAAPVEVPAGFLLPLMDAAGNVADDDVADIFASILAAGVELEDARHPLFLHLAKQLSGNDAKVLNHLAINGPAPAIVLQPATGYASRPYCKVEQVAACSRRDPRGYPTNLVVLRLVTVEYSGRPGDIEPIAPREQFEQLRDEALSHYGVTDRGAPYMCGRARLTEAGARLMRICHEGRVVETTPFQDYVIGTEFD